MALINSFNKTNLDLENPAPLGGPINDTTSGFLHKNLPGTPATYYQSVVTQTTSRLANPTTFEKTNLDLESPLLTGGPINDSDSGFLHKNLPTNPTTHYQSVVTQTTSPLANPTTFQRTNLDLESPLQAGGPINDPSPGSGFLHKNLPTNPATHYKNIVNLNTSPLRSNVFQNTDLDLESPLQAGGPINDPFPGSGFNHRYLPTNWYTYTSNRPG